ncbi:hypothetical protein GWK47_046091 [Chionoecetes opilio]|uniref:Carboxylesterase type B domain-containing protein n=1 Tax=Chionoecetes opilio TaxID=41210 RepID=A0A8J5CTT5_CHIOP|nr:hypothetical protein GWK47_046091 [Chionoecetes opilio]
MVDRMTKVWTNFAKYGDPTPDVVSDTRDEWEGEIEKWLPYDLVNQNYMLVQDNFTMSLDFTTRWNYHSNRSTEEPTTTPMPDMVGRDSYNDMKLAKENFQIATGVLGALTACCVILFVIVYVRKRRKLNTIV